MNESYRNLRGLLSSLPCSQRSLCLPAAGSGWASCPHCGGSRRKQTLGFAGQRLWAAACLTFPLTLSFCPLTLVQEPPCAGPVSHESMPTSLAN
jgi:hypothetical protein